jgi:hypothetical protein
LVGLPTDFRTGFGITTTNEPISTRPLSESLTGEIEYRQRGLFNRSRQSNWEHGSSFLEVSEFFDRISSPANLLTHPPIC